MHSGAADEHREPRSPAELQDAEILRRFEREGLVEGRVGCLRVLDEPALRRIAGA